MTAKKAVKRGFDFSAMDTVKASNEGKFFSFIDIESGDEVEAGAIMLGADSEEYQRAHFRVQQEFSKTKKGKDGALDESQWENFERLEKVIACCKSLKDCFIGDKEYADNKDDIREFFTMLPLMRDQMWARLSSRANFLNRADKAGSAT
jgi:hypothetical protein